MPGVTASRVLKVAGTLASLILLGSVPASAQTGGNVLLVANAASEVSVRIAEHYAKARGVPDGQVLRLEGLAADPPDDIDRGAFNQLIQAPITRWLTLNQAQDRILFLVLTKGIPLRIKAGQVARSVASVDSELTVLYMRLSGVNVPIAGPFPNPYFLGERPVAEAKPFRRDDQSLYLVTRLDGYTEADVIALIDRGVAPAGEGSRVVLDGKASWSENGNAWLTQAAERLRAAGWSDERIAYDASSAVLADQKDVVGYYSWGSNDPAIKRRNFGLQFRPGAIGAMFVSSDGRTFREPAREWALGSWNDKSTWSGGSPQSLAGDLIREGITGIAGHVAEPLLSNTVHPNVLFPAYAAGLTLAEAYYLSIPSLSWMTVVIGDPLCAPFMNPSNAPAVLESTIDPETDLPVWFAKRRIKKEMLTGAAEPVAKLLVRAEGKILRQDREGARTGLEEALRLDPRNLTALEGLAAMAAADGQAVAALDYNKRIIEIDPRNVVALNNVAYHLVEAGRPLDGLPFAQRARTLAPGVPAIADTLAWIHFRSGQARLAVPLIAEAQRGAPRSAEIALHAAEIFLAVERPAEARGALERALALRPQLSEDAVVKRLRAALP